MSRYQVWLQSWRYPPAVTLGQRLRSLDDRVLGKPKPPTTATYRNSFLVGLAGAVAMLVVLAITGKWSFVGSIGGFLGVMLGSGVRWRRFARAQGR